ncbi:MAG TPA: HAD family acid phosphatase [Marmoricola sp.]
MPVTPGEPAPDPGRHLDYRQGGRSAVIAGALAALAAIVGATALAVSLHDHHHDDPAGQGVSRPTASPTPTPSATASPTKRASHKPRPERSSAPPSPTPVITATSFPVMGHTVESTKGLPSKAGWLADVAATLEQSHAADYLRQRAASGQSHLAINLDIDNTVNESHYSGIGAIPPMAELISLAHDLGYAVLFNTGRSEKLHNSTVALLNRDGFPVDGLCMRQPGEGLVHSKQRCRARYRSQGWTLVENIGNHPTDLTGSGYELGIMLPNYGMRLS